MTLAGKGCLLYLCRMGFFFFFLFLFFGGCGGGVGGVCVYGRGGVKYSISVSARPKT